MRQHLKKNNKIFIRSRVTKRKVFLGLSLIEVLIVTSILGVLATSISLTFVNKLKIARDAKRKIDIEKVKGAMDEYYETAQCFPRTLPACGQALTLNSNVYLDEIPCDILTKQSYYYESEPTACPSWYRLYAKLENGSDISIRLANCTYGCGPSCVYNYGVSSSNTALTFCEAPVTPTEVQPTNTPSPTSSPTPTPLLYACSPGGGQLGSCEQYDDPYISECPKIYPNDPTCKNECSKSVNRCKNSKGKHIPK